jgi:hypothetical protein
LATDTLIVSREGANPLGEDMLNQGDPSAVLLVAVQDKLPDPPLRMSMVWLVIVVPEVSIEKLILPGVLSKNVPPEGAIIKVTGTVIAWEANCEKMTTCPV